MTQAIPTIARAIVEICRSASQSPRPHLWQCPHDRTLAMSTRPADWGANDMGEAKRKREQHNGIAADPAFRQRIAAEVRSGHRSDHAGHDGRRRGLPVFARSLAGTSCASMALPLVFMSAACSTGSAPIHIATWLPTAVSRIAAATSTAAGQRLFHIWVGVDDDVVDLLGRRLARANAQSRLRNAGAALRRRARFRSDPMD